MADVLPQNEKKELLFHFQDQVDTPHLSSELGVRRYIKMADQIAKVLPAGKILDWGAGCGQMTYLLKNRGLEVVSYELDPEERPLLKKINHDIIIGTDSVNLPFADSSFDAVLSSGVLEHVIDDQASLKEIYRILKPGGYFFIYMLPNKYSYIEFVSDRLGRGDHPVKYSMGSIKTMLREQGFEVLSTGYQNFLPYNLKGFPCGLQKIYHRFDWLNEKLDLFFTKFPLLKGLSTNLIVVARKK